eukprot:57706_1
MHLMNMSTSSLLTLKQQELLIDGYCKTNYTYDLPIILIKLILSMYNEIFYWKFETKQSKSSITTPQTARILSKPFIVKGLKFAYCIYPSGHDQQVQYGLILLDMSAHIDYVIVNQIHYFKEFDTCLHLTLKYDNNNTFWGVCITTLQYIKNNMNNEINFWNKFELIRIQPKDLVKHKSLIYHKPNITMKKNICFQWNINDKLLETIKSKFINTQYRKWYRSPIFDNWTMILKQSHVNSSMYFFGFLLHQFPDDIKSITFEYCVELNRDGKRLRKWNNIGTWDYNNISLTTGKLIEEFNQTFVWETSSLDAKIDIQIQKICDMSDNYVEKVNWHKYGIID